MKHNNFFAFVITSYVLLVASVAFAASPAPVNLGSAARFAVLAGSGITNSRMSIISGDVGLSPAGRVSIVGLGTDEVTGKIYAADDATIGVPQMLTQAKNDLASAYADASGRIANAIPLSGDLGGQTLAPGLYTTTGQLQLSTGILTLDGEGDPNAVWIFRIGTELQVASGRTIALTGGAQAQNIYWEVGATANIGSGAIVRGVIMADQSIVLGPIARLDGMALSKNGSVTLAYNFVTVPTDAPAVAIPSPFYPAVAATPASSTAFVAQPPVATPPAPAPTASVDAQLSGLLAQLADLQKQVAQSAPAVVSGEGQAIPPKTAAIVLTEKAAAIGTTKQLQVFLNAHGFSIAKTGAGSPGKETNTFGAATRRALCKFQVDRGIVPSSSRSCGVYGPKTKKVVRDMSQY